MENDTPPAATPVVPAPAPTPAPAPVQPPAVPDNSVRVEGVLDIDNSRNGSLLDLARFGRNRPTDPFVPRELIRRFKLQQGNLITAMAAPDGRFPNPKVRFIEKVDGMDIEARRRMLDFPNLLTITPNEQIRL